MRSLCFILTVIGALSPTATAVDIDFSSDKSVKDGAAKLAYGLMKYYIGNETGQIPGLLPDPYYWWEAGAMFGTMIDYWVYTGDTTYNSVTYQAMVHQTGENKDYVPKNQTLTEGNDDQGFWALAAMSAAETNFQNPPPDLPQWLALAQGVFNQYARRWETGACNGGLRWQIVYGNNGWTYKNTISNGCFFSLAARLARYTGNTTYSDWAVKVWDWTTGVGLINEQYAVFDGGNMPDNCSALNKAQFSYNVAIYLHGAAAMYNMTESPLWKTRTEGLLKNAEATFFNNSIAYEPICEPQLKCGTDALSFKAYLTRWLAYTVQMAGFTAESILPLLQASAKGAAAQCSGTATATSGTISGIACGSWWNVSSWDGTHGVGEQMSGLSAVIYSMVQGASVPLTSDNGGTSIGNPNAGSGTTDDPRYERPITAGDRAGAGILTVVNIVGLVTIFLFIAKGEVS